jgi:DNA-directed RNA polymerase I subunit RPA2
MTQVFASNIDGRRMVVIQLDGRVIGWASSAKSKYLANFLRRLKTEGDKKVPLDIEIGYIPVTKGGQYPGLYLFSSRSRMMRLVSFLENGKTDHLGTFEQVYMDVACTPQEIEKGVSTHVELDPTSMLSVIANLTPFSDFNQSPRNMYQCQMGKQSMGTPSTALTKRTDNKMYRLQTGQTPVVRPELHNHYGFDSFPNGMNAVVAVISYTGYDMEDAMILNKSAHERGFGYGTIYKADIFDLKDVAGASKTSRPTLHFGLGRDVKTDSDHHKFMTRDGLPRLGMRVKSGDPMCAYVDDVNGRTKVHKYKGDETAYIDEVRLLGIDTGDSELQKVHIKLRIPRAPVIGDKFSSRHGQKGVCSQKYPAIDMPFSESGMQPDVIINPHAFPSRMTIGMFVESLAGKAGALHGIAQDATPFR